MPINNIVIQRLEKYDCKTSHEQENAIKEITQEILLFAFQKSGFFKHAAFQGGTALRIMYGLNRFSEDLDFTLINPDIKFKVSAYLNSVSQFMKAFGYELEITGTDKVENNIRIRFLKDESLKKIISFSHKADLRKKIKIKFELDTNPPPGAEFENKLINFPLDYYITSQTIESLFSGKNHALLCRKYTKGRDWYDFSWYVNHKVKINFNFLKNALMQMGPFKGKTAMKIDKKWYIEQITSKIKSINWKEAKKDSLPFVKSFEQESVNLWNEDYFLNKVKVLKEYI